MSPMSTKTKHRSGRKRKRTVWWAVALGTVVSLAVVFAVVNNSGEAPGEPAPEIALPDFDGETVRLTDFEGQSLVVNYWASWCAPCLAEMPGFERLYQQRQGEVAFLGINLTDDPRAAEMVREQTGITYPVARDADGSAFEAFGAFGMPTTVFITPTGEIVELYTGEMSAEALAERIDRYFGDL